MLRGFLSGVIWGSVVGAAVLAVLSLFSQPTGQAPQADGSDAQPVEQSDASRSESANNDIAIPADPIGQTAGLKGVAVPDEQKVAPLPQAALPAPPTRRAPATNRAAEDGVIPKLPVAVVPSRKPVKPEQVVDLPTEDSPEIPTENLDVTQLGVDTSSEPIVEVEPELPPSVSAEAATSLPGTGPNETAPETPASEEIVTQSGALAPVPLGSVAGIAGNAVADDPEISLSTTQTLSAPEIITKTAVLARAPGEDAVAELPEPDAPGALALDIRDNPDLSAAPAQRLAAPTIEDVVEIEDPNEQTQDIATLAPTKDLIEKVAGDGDVAADETVAANEVGEDPLKRLRSSTTTEVVINRLPTVADPTTDEAAEPEATGTEEAPESDAPDDSVTELAALEAFAAATELNGTPALMSFIVIDAGGAGVSREALKDLSVPVTIALDPVVAGASDAMRDYRGAGKEVIAMLNDLPTSAAPTDVATAMSGYFDILDEAIGLIDPLDGRIQDNRGLLEPVLGAIGQTGHGIATFDKGLNPALAAAARVGVPAASVFRVLDAEQEKSNKIKRYLDRAAFKAGQDGSVLIVGHSYPETIKAIEEWAAANQNDALAVVPASAIMKRSVE